MHLLDSEKCPICSSKFKIYRAGKEFILKCNNDCFEYDFSFSGVLVYIFNEQFICGDLLAMEITNRVKEKIDYWLEDERYVMKILSK